MAGIQIGVTALPNTADTQSSIQHSDAGYQKKITSSLIERYSLSPTVDDITSRGALFRDLAERKIGVCYGEIRGNLIHTSAPYADIMVIGTNQGMLLGWIDGDKMTDATDRFLIPVKALSPMPTTFRFAQKCPHMSVYGGYLDRSEGHWRCFGCDALIPFVG